MIPEQYQKIIDTAFEKIKKENETAGIYEKATGKKEHEDFWETYIGNKILHTGQKIGRLQGKGRPDYFIEGEKFNLHIEAKAPTKGNPKENADIFPKGIPVLDIENGLENCTAPQLSSRKSERI